MIVYGLHSGDGDIRYVGKTTKTAAGRLSEHRSSARQGKPQPVYNWMRKHGVEAIEVVALEIADDIESLWVLEMFWIAQYRDIGAALLNVSDGGPGSSGWKHTPETRQRLSEIHASRERSYSAETRGRLSEAAKRRNITPELSRRLSQALKGKKRTDDQRAAQSARMTGRKLSDATREKMRVAQQARRERERGEQ